MRYLLIVVVALFSCISDRSDASPEACDATGIIFCPTIALSVTDAVTGKHTNDNFDNIPVVNQFEPLKFEIVTTFQPVGIVGIPHATGITGIFGDPPLGAPGSPAYSFQPGSPPFIQTTDVSNQLTNNGENFFFSGYFTASGLGKIDSTVIDNAGNDWTLGTFAMPGDIIDVRPNVPEVSTWAMLLIGFAAIGGFAGYRRSRSRQVAIV
jgi:hypothetical protein